MFESNWLEGPDCMRKRTDEWPKIKEDYPEEEVNLLINKSNVIAVVMDNLIFTSYFFNFSNHKTFVALWAGF